MSESEEEENNFCFYGTPLEPYDEDTFPKRKPIAMEDQIATDAQGRRRFHGAFTGGFSAGFFNTVGTPEGWTPSEFKSSRADKAASKRQRPQDFMDDEDMGEFGIAPETVKATDEYSTKKKRKKQAYSTGPIPGIPVLHSLLEVHTETIGYTLMKNMGWKVAQDSDDDEPELPETSEGGKVYGCVIPKEFRNLGEKFTISAKVLQEKNPYVEFVSKPKDNSFGMGYKGLDRNIFGHVNLLEPSSFVVRDKSNKRATVRGQAFGVGAFEKEDEDIYKADDMSRYDFSIEHPSEKSKPDTSQKAITYRTKDQDCPIEDFVKAKNPFVFPSNFPPPTIPHSFSGKHKVKRSRFEPIPETAQTSNQTEQRKVTHNAETRKELLEDREKERERRREAAAEARKKNLDMLLNSNRFVSSKPSEDVKSEESSSKEENPFFKDRFVSAAQPDDPTNALVEVQRTESMHGTKDMRKAAEMKMFGPLTRISYSWNPSALLCKRFNVPVPLFDGYAEKKKQNEKRNKLLIFEYQKAKDAQLELKPGLTETKVPEPEEEGEEEPTAIVETKEDSQNEDAKSKEAIKESQVSVAENETADEKEEISPEKNMDLFKAVFLSSSSEDEQSDAEQEKEKEQTHKEMIVKEIEQVTLPKIAPRKMGILSNITFAKPPPMQERENSATTNKDDDEDVNEASKSNLYGPQLPVNINKTKTALSSSSTSSFSGNSVRASTNFIKSSRADDDGWIEKDSRDTDRHKHKKKKHKKDDDKKTKHKSAKHKKHKKNKR